MMNIDMNNQNQIEDEGVAKQNRIKLYKGILNYYRGRSLSLNSVLASEQPSLTITPEMKTHENLCKDIQGLHDDIILIESMKNCVNLINSSLASTEVMSVNNLNFRRETLNKIEGIIYFSKSIMKLYSECYTEMEIIEKMKNYSSALTEYMKNLERLKEAEKNSTYQDSVEMEKAQLHIYKINLMRTMKSVLIGYISVNCPDLLKNVKDFKTASRKDLTIDDFRDTWDVGLSA